LDQSLPILFVVCGAQSLGRYHLSSTPGPPYLLQIYKDLKMERILPDAILVPVAKVIEQVYAYGPLADKTVVLGKFVCRNHLSVLQNEILVEDIHVST